MLAQADPTWNSLEIVKLLVGVLTPLSVAVFGWWISRRLKVFEHLQWANQRVVEKRLRVYEELVPLLNDLLCYFTYVGSWKSREPAEIIASKRRLDRIAYVNAPLLPQDFLKQYNAFISLCFHTYSGWGQDAKLRTKSQRRKEALADAWQDSWADCFACDEDCTEPAELQNAYHDLVAYLARELGVGVQAKAVETGRLPTHIR